MANRWATSCAHWRNGGDRISNGSTTKRTAQARPIRGKSPRWHWSSFAAQTQCFAGLDRRLEVHARGSGPYATVQIKADKIQKFVVSASRIQASITQTAAVQP